MCLNKRSEEVPLHDIRQMSSHFFLMLCKDNGSALLLNSVITLYVIQSCVEKKTKG